MPVVEKKKGHIDYVLLGIVTVLVIWGILMMASISVSFSQERFGNSFYFLLHQIGLGVLPGGLAGFLAFKMPLSFFRKWALVLLLINLFLLAIVFVPKIGTDFGDASRWINLGPISFQPTEPLKLSFILYLAAWLTSRHQKMKKEDEKGFSQTLFAFLIVIGILGLLLYFQPDISTLGIIIFTAAFTYFLAGMPLWHMLLGGALGAASFYLLLRTATYRMERWLTLLKPGTDPLRMSYQIQQALMGIGAGGIFGLGLGMSRQKAGLLPYPMSDSIFAVLAEEMGFIGGLCLILLFLIFAWQGFKIARRVNDRFSQLTALGITIWITLQAFFNIGSITGVLPLMGIPLPFISYGGSALISELVGVSILLSISRSGR